MRCWHSKDRIWLTRRLGPTTAPTKNVSQRAVTPVLCSRTSQEDVNTHSCAGCCAYWLMTDAPHRYSGRFPKQRDKTAFCARRSTRLSAFKEGCQFKQRDSSGLLCPSSLLVKMAKCSQVFTKDVFHCRPFYRSKARSPGFSMKARLQLTLL